MHELVEGRRTQVDVLLHTATAGSHVPAPRPGLGPGDVICRLKHDGAASWRDKALDPVTWQDADHGVYVLTIEPDDLAAGNTLTVLIAGRPGVEPPIAPLLRTFRIVPPPPRKLGTDLPRTTVCGRILTSDHRPKPKLLVTFRLTTPTSIGGIAITPEPVSVETDQDGYFQVDLITGLNVTVQIQALNYNRAIVIPPPAAPGLPVRLFSL